MTLREFFSPRGSATTVCEKCGQTVHIGEWPYCPHGTGNNLQKPMEPYTDDMIAATPVEFSTMSEKVKYMDRNAIIEARDRVRHDRGYEPSRGEIHAAIRDTIQELRR